MDEHQIPVQEHKIIETREEQIQRARTIEFDKLNPEEYRNKDTRTNKEIENVIKETNALLQEDDQKTQEHDRLEVHTRLQKEIDIKEAKRQQTIRDKKWYNLFDGDSEAMTEFKNALNYLNNLMDQEIPINPQTKKIDGQAVKQILGPAYVTLNTACLRYINSHSGRRHATGRRRLKNVKIAQELIETERQRLDLAIDNVNDDTLYEKDKVRKLRDLFPRVAVNEAVVSRKMEEGNSSDVFRVRLRAGNKYYYAKEDLKLLNEDLPGYLNRRMQQLQDSQAKRKKQMEGLKSPAEYEAKSKEQDELIASIDKLVPVISAKAPGKRLAEEDAKALKALSEKLVERGLMTQERADELINNEELTDAEADELVYSIRKDQEELRLRGRIDDDDYKAGLDFLGAMNDKLAHLSKDAKAPLIKRYIEFLGHDFDRLFNQLAQFNIKVSGKFNTIDDVIDMLESDKDRAKFADTIAMLKAKKAAQGNAAVNPMTPYEYICDLVKQGKMGLDAAQDQDILDILKNLQMKDGEKNVDGARVQRLFTRTLGKEAELFGQQYERGGAGDSAILASNNTATSRMARALGFGDVVALSHKCMMKNRGDKQYKMYTLSEEAEGEEMLALVTQAKKEGATLQYSPNAVRQLMRLQLFDTLCLQTDRHWRNFKCKVNKKGNKWIIESLKSYDHDQSFGARTLDDYFKEQLESMGQTGQLGFINPYVMTISKDDKRYRYIREKFIGGSDDKVLDSIEMPDGQKFKTQLKKSPKLTGGHGRGHDRYKKFRNNPKYKDGVPVVEWFIPATTSYWNHYNMEFMFDGDELIKKANGVKKVRKGEVESEENKKKRELIEQFWSKFKQIYYAESPESKPEMTDEYKLNILRALREAKELYDQIDFSKIEETARAENQIDRLMPRTYKELLPETDHDLTSRDGYFGYMVQNLMFRVKNQFATPENIAKLQEEDMKEYIKEQEEEQKKKTGDPNVSLNDQIKKQQQLCGIGSDTLKIPTMLHMDKEAFDKIRSVAEGGENHPLVDAIMRELNWDEKKRSALITRAGELVKQIQEAAEIADAWYENWNETLKNPDPANKQWKREEDPRYIPKTDPRRKFFLEHNREEKVVENGVEVTKTVDDYALLTNLTDFATDPSMTYFSIEDPNFLAGEQKYVKYLDERDKENAVKLSNKCREQPRQHGLEQMKNFSDYKPLVGNQIG